MFGFRSTSHLQERVRGLIVVTKWFKTSSTEDTGGALHLTTVCTKRKIALCLKCNIITIRSYECVLPKPFLSCPCFKREVVKIHRCAFLQPLRWVAFPWSQMVKCTSKCVQMEGLFVVLSSQAMCNHPPSPPTPQKLKSKQEKIKMN